MKREETSTTVIWKKKLISTNNLPTPYNIKSKSSCRGDTDPKLHHTLAGVHPPGIPPVNLPLFVMPVPSTVLPRNRSRLLIRPFHANGVLVTATRMRLWSSGKYHVKPCTLFCCRSMMCIMYCVMCLFIKHGVPQFSYWMSFLVAFVYVCVLWYDICDVQALHIPFPHCQLFAWYE